MLGCSFPRARQPSMGSALQTGVTKLRLDFPHDACPRSAPRSAAAPESPRAGPVAVDAGRFRNQPLAGRARHLGLGLGLLRSSGRGRAGRLVRCGRAVPAADGPADPAYRNHPAQQGTHRRQSRPVRARPVPGAGCAAGQAAGVRSSQPPRQLAGRPGALADAGRHGPRLGPAGAGFLRRNRRTPPAARLCGAAAAAVECRRHRR
ncbi:Uncharacterised protein [Stenotrophomonas maltophilia]|nr:Uncharacterised protein [Stenotrophomonas maltophilia]